MKSPTMPKEHFEKNVGKLSSANLKYAGEFSNPEDLKESNDKLAGFVKKHKMKY